MQSLRFIPFPILAPLTWLKKYRYYILGALALLVLFVLVKEAMGSGDFRCYLNAAIRAAKGKNPYTRWIFISEQSSCLYFYSPLWLVLLTPFIDLPQFIPNIIWLVLMVLFLIRSWQIILGFWPKTSFTEKQRLFIVIGSLLFTIRFIQLDVAMIQMTSFMLWTSLEALHQFRKGNVIVGAAILALSINIKIIPIVLLPYLLYRSAFKPFFLTILFVMGYTLLPSLVFGWDFNMVLIESWFQQINPLKDQHLVETELGPHSLTALIPNLFSSTEGTLELKRNLLDLTPSQAMMVLQGIRAVLILGTLLFLGWPPFRKMRSMAEELPTLSYLFLLIPLIFPHQQKYAFVFIAPAALYVMHFLVSQWAHRRRVEIRTKYMTVLTLFSASFVLMTLTTDGLIGRELNNITQHYKLITWGALLLIITLFLLKDVHRVVDNLDVEIES